MGYQHDGAIRVTGKAIDFIKSFLEEGNDEYTEGALYFNFDKFGEAVGGLSEHTTNYWPGSEECEYWERNGVGYLGFSFYGTFTPFPYEIAQKLSVVFPNQEFGGECTTEDRGSSLMVFKNGERIFEDYYDSDDDSEEPEKENPSSITFENFYEKEILSPEEEARRKKHSEERIWFWEHKEELPKNDDDTYIITDDMPDGAKELALEHNEYVFREKRAKEAKEKEPTYEEIVNAYGSKHLFDGDLMKAISWLDHHDHLSDKYGYPIITDDMPLLVKAYIVIRRKEEEEQSKIWDEIMEKYYKDHPEEDDDSD